MNYVYDVLLNFQKRFYDFFEWNEKDEITHMRKIPLFRVSSSDFFNFKNGILKFNKDFLDLIYNKAERFKRGSNLSYVFLVSNTKEVIGVKLNKNGVIISKSSLLLDECDDVALMSSDLKVFEFEYKVLDLEEIGFKTREEVEKGCLIINKLEQLYHYKEDDKLKFLYLECFGECEDDIFKIFSILKNEIMEYKENYYKIFDFFKLLEQK